MFDASTTPTDPAPDPTGPAVADPKADPAAAAAGFADYTPVALRTRSDGWTAERQRTFLTVLAETGAISTACAKAGVSSRSAYRLRTHPDAAAFASGWDQALKLATVRLTTLAFERATRGTVREVWRNGELVMQTRMPSDRLLMFLLQHLLPAGKPGDRWRVRGDDRRRARAFSRDAGRDRGPCGGDGADRDARLLRFLPGRPGRGRVTAARARHEWYFSDLPRGRRGRTPARRTRQGRRMSPSPAPARRRIEPIRSE